MPLETFRLWLLACLTLIMVALGLWEMRRRNGFAGLKTFDWRRALRYGLYWVDATAVLELVLLAGEPLSASLLLFAIGVPLLAGMLFGPLFVANENRHYGGARYRRRRARNEREAERMTGLRKKLKLWFGV